jgi:tetratricopeptide (TPR) repeat protein
LTSLLFHIVNTLLLFWVLKRMTGEVWASAFVAAAFAIHPLHVESVAWVAERKDVLSGFFWMLTMAAYIRYAKQLDIRRYLLVGWLWYVITLVPVIGLVQVGGQAMADRYTYLPSVGIFIMVAWGVSELVAKWRLRKIVLGILAGIVLALLLLCTRMQVRYWQNDLTLFGHTLKATGNHYVMHNEYGVALLRAGQFGEAMKHFNESLRIEPRYLEARNSIGKALLVQGKIDEAIECFVELLRDRADWADVYNNLGTAYARQGKYELAIENYRKALELKPDYPAAINNLKIALEEQAKINHQRKKPDEEK